MTIPTVVQARLAAQHVAKPDFKKPEDVVRWFGAVQSQDLQAGLYALNLRLKNPLTAAQLEACIANKRLVRTWPMRGTIHFVPPEDLRWMLKLLAHRVTTRVTGMYKKEGLTQKEFLAARQMLVSSMAGRPPVRRPELNQALIKAGLAKKGELGAMFILGYWAQHGLICLGPRDGKQQTFVLVDEWLPPQKAEPNQDQALAILAHRYFTSHGPATLQDFAWWSGLSMAEARQGLTANQSKLASTEVLGQIYWHAPAGGPMPPQTDAVYLLPQYDELTVAYKDRSAFVPDTLSKAESQHGIGPSIIVGGQLAGIWKRQINKDHVAVGLHLFTPLSAKQKDGLNRTIDNYALHVGLPPKVFTF